DHPFRVREMAAAIMRANWRPDGVIEDMRRGWRSHCRKNVRRELCAVMSGLLPAARDVTASSSSNSVALHGVRTDSIADAVIRRVRAAVRVQLALIGDRDYTERSRQ